MIEFVRKMLIFGLVFLSKGRDNRWRRSGDKDSRRDRPRSREDRERGRRGRNSRSRSLNQHRDRDSSGNRRKSLKVERVMRVNAYD